MESFEATSNEHSCLVITKMCAHSTAKGNRNIDNTKEILEDIMHHISGLNNIQYPMIQCNVIETLSSVSYFNFHIFIFHRHNIHSIKQQAVSSCSTVTTAVIRSCYFKSKHNNLGKKTWKKTTDWNGVVRLLSEHSIIRRFALVA